MTDIDFETMLRFKAGAGIVPLCQWVRELHAEHRRTEKALKDALDGTNAEARKMVGGLTK